jgi:4-diphosphocytidyl-2-C-methyl-D-erythritol kinase
VNDGHRQESVVVAAPAKLNLTLLVGPRRSDGFHEIASLMVPVTLSDLVEVTPTPGRPFALDCPVAPGEANLGARMVRALETRLDRSFEVHVAIQKRIPAGAGLGGGSSDAAAVLRALERLFELDLSPRVRHEVALSVGSDVPFFLWTGPQLAMGRGQVLKPVDLPGPLHFVVAVPDLHLSTADVYRWRDEDVTVALHDFAPRARLLSAGIAAARTVADVAGLVSNDLEITAVERAPEVGRVIERLNAAGAAAAAMTGSGAAVFGLFETVEAAERVRAAVGTPYAWSVTELQEEPVKRRGERTGRRAEGRRPPAGAPRRRPSGEPRRTPRRRPPKGGG